MANVSDVILVALESVPDRQRQGALDAIAPWSWLRIGVQLV